MSGSGHCQTCVLVSGHKASAVGVVLPPQGEESGHRHLLQTVTSRESPDSASGPRSEWHSPSEAEWGCGERTGRAGVRPTRRSFLLSNRWARLSFLLIFSQSCGRRWACPQPPAGGWPRSQAGGSRGPCSSCFQVKFHHRQTLRAVTGHWVLVAAGTPSRLCGHRRHLPLPSHFCPRLHLHVTQLRHCPALCGGNPPGPGQPGLDSKSSLRSSSWEPKSWEATS